MVDRTGIGEAAGVKTGRLFLRAAGSVANQIRRPDFARRPKIGFDQSRKMARIVVT